MATPSTQQQLQQQQDYFRSVSNESTTYMMVPAAGQRDRERREAPSKMWVAMVVIVVVVLQIASTTGLFVYLNMSISQVRSEGVTEELKCLSLLNALDKNEDIPEQLAQLFGEPCIKLAEGIKAYISKLFPGVVFLCSLSPAGVWLSPGPQWCCWTRFTQNIHSVAQGLRFRLDDHREACLARDVVLERTLNL
ncbi:unnamed protein product [Arctogadus glacialis]